MAMREELVPVGPLAEAFQRSGRTAEKVAEDCGWFRQQKNRQRPAGDASVLLRRLGLKEEGNKGKRKLREELPYGMAVRICDALGCDPYEVGV